MASSLLTEHALVVHLFATLGGPRTEGAYSGLRSAWEACGEGLDMTDAIAHTGLPVALPEEAGALPSAGPVAVRQAPGAGVRQALLSRRHDVLLCSVVLSPSEPTDWERLDRIWETAIGPTDAWAMGEVRLYTALHPPSTAYDALTAALRAVLPGAAQDGLTQGADVPGGIRVWETAAHPDDRRVRRIAVVAPVENGPHLDAWAWSRGDPQPPPAARYLQHAAKLRYELRVHASSGTVRDLVDRVDTAVDAGLSTLAAGTTGTGTGHDGDSAVADRARLADVMAGARGLTRSLTRRREMARTVEIAVGNMTALRSGWGTTQPAEGDLFADDADVARWFRAELDHEVLYLDATRERAQDVTAALADFQQQALQERREHMQCRKEAEQRRQSELNLLQTAWVGGVVMVLAAIQAFTYTVPVPGPVMPGVIALLGAIALLLATGALWQAAQPSRAVVGAGLAAGGLTGAALGWLTAAVVAHLRWEDPASVPVTVASASIGLTAGVAAMYRVRVRVRRS
ncbi:CATRA conflict system CASPASE/TPR repeat-associated protein [Streptomyces sp. NPDC048723]|uniref:CATRA conflict system CASPASE/TPR repeat-associated protein n=1 Tax=Streptomyces sp. NPDC048723 TaxID=3365589 RepID=UPI00371FD5BA